MFRLLRAFVVVLLLGLVAQAKAEEVRAFVGTYTGGESKGVYTFKLDLKTGKATKPMLAVETESPSFLAMHPSHGFLYAVNETADYKGEKTGAVSAFSIDKETGTLTFLNQQPSGGAHPCHVSVDSDGEYVLVANYTGGSVSSFPAGEDGKLGKAISVIQHKGSSVNPRQKSPHAHSINLDASNQFAVVADLGLDKVLVYRIKNGSLEANEPDGVAVEPASGPRHFAFHPGGKTAYVINEISLTVTAFDWDSGKGILKPVQTISTVPQGTTDRKGMSTADVQVHPSGKFLFGSNRGHDSIVVYSIDSDTGKLTYVENESTQGKTPRNFAIDPTGTFLLAENQNSGTIALFRINQETGELDATGEVIDAPSPVCIKFMPLD